MSDVRGLPESVLQALQVDRSQDLQQRQTSVDQRVAGHQFSQRVGEKRSQVNTMPRVESDPLGDGGSEGGRGERFEEPQPETPPERPDPEDPDLGHTIDLKA